MRSQNYWYINQNTSSLQSCTPLCNKPQYYSMYFEMCRQTTVCYLTNYFKNLITMHYLKRQGKIWYVWLLSNNGYSTLMPRVFNVHRNMRLRMKRYFWQDIDFIWNIDLANVFALQDDKDDLKYYLELLTCSQLLVGPIVCRRLHHQLFCVCLIFYLLCLKTDQKFLQKAESAFGGRKTQHKISRDMN